MFRSIKVLRSLSGEPEREPNDTEIREAALQFVRKISGYRKPAQANELAFDAAVDQVALASRTLLFSLKSGRQPATIQ